MVFEKKGKCDVCVLVCAQRLSIKRGQIVASTKGKCFGEGERRELSDQDEVAYNTLLRCSNITKLIFPYATDDDNEILSSQPQ